MASLKERQKQRASATVVPPAVTRPKPSRLRSLGRLVARHPRIVQAIVLLAVFSGTGVFLLYLLFRDAWSPEQDNLGVLRTIWEMETSRESTLAMPDNPQQVVTRSYDTLEASVEADGWVWINRFGSTITYGKQEQRLIASCSPYSPLYLICNLSEIP